MGHSFVKRSFLSEKERSIVMLIIQRHSKKDIEKELNLGVGSFARYTRNVRIKLGIPPDVDLWEYFGPGKEVL